MRRPTHEDLLDGKVDTVSIINEPVVDFVVDHAVKGETAREKAKRLWRMEPDDHE